MESKEFLPGRLVLGTLHAASHILIPALLLTIMMISSPPAFAWWFFKHHHQNDPATLPPQSNATDNLIQRPDIDSPVSPRSPDARTSTRVEPLHFSSKISVAIATNINQDEITTLDGAQLTDATSGTTMGWLAPRSNWLACSTLGSGLALSSKPPNPGALKQLAAVARSNSQTPEATIVPVTYLGTANPSRSTPYISDTSSYPQATSRYENDGQSGFYITPPIVSGKESLVGFNGRLYRGKLLLKPINSSAQGQSGRFNVINVVEIEDYLQSVVPSEMPSAWPAEALKSQAIAARSYAYANLGKNAKNGFDVKDNTEDQVYLGVQSEAHSTNMAVQGTNGLIISYEGKPICAYFHATSGGGTDLAENIWGKALPYLRSVPDYDDNAPLFTWSRNFSVTQLENTIGQGLGPLLAFVVLSRSPAQRVKNVLLLGSREGKVLSGENLRYLLKLPSTNFNICPTAGGYVFAGRGFGHGLGLSQWGAKTLAEHGYNAAQILTYYYKDVIVEPLAGVPGA